VDDSVLTGRQMHLARQSLRALESRHSIQYGAAYVEPGMESAVDFHHQSLPYPRMFEWNMMHHRMLGQACVDVDGVLCRDPTPEENDDGPRYDAFIESVAARVAPTYTIGTLVTARLEKYRAATEDWLARHRIQFRALLMMPYTTKAERLAAGRHAAFKAEAYVASRASIFIESNRLQARDIAEMTNRPVICTDTMRLCTAAIRSKSDIADGLRRAGSPRRRIRWLARQRRAILWWAKRRVTRRREGRSL
jgi:orotate phosphoribosyltransferase